MAEQESTLKLIITAVATDAKRVFDDLNDQVKDHKELLQSVGLVAGGMFAALVAGIKKSVEAATELNNTMKGLKSIAEANNVAFDAATKAAKALASDGLMTVSDAATGLKNLLARGFNLQEATDLMNRFKDSAAFGRQSSLDFGEAIRGATEGLKNENSMLVDNAGVTKNVAQMWKEYKKEHNISGDLTLSQKRQAEFAGIMKETAAQVGDAAQMTKGLSGQQAALNATTTELWQTIGEAFVPVLQDLISMIVPIVKSVTEFAKENKPLIVTVGSLAVAFTGLVASFAGWTLIAPAVMATFATFKTLMLGSMLTPIGAVTAAVGLLVLAFTTDFMGSRVLIMQTVAGISAEFKILGAAIALVWNSVTSPLSVGTHLTAFKDRLVEIAGEVKKTHDDIETSRQEEQVNAARAAVLRKKQTDDQAAADKDAEDQKRKERLKTLDEDLRAGAISKAEYVRRAQEELASDQLTSAERTKLRITLHNVQQQLTAEEAKVARQHAHELNALKHRHHQDELQRKREQAITGNAVTLALIEAQKLLTAHHLGTGLAAQHFLETLRKSVPVMKALGYTATEMTAEFKKATRAAIEAAEAAKRARGGAIILDGQRFSSPSDDDNNTYTRDEHGGLQKVSDFGDLMKNVQVHDNGGIAAYTGLHWLQQGEKTIPPSQVSNSTTNNVNVNGRQIATTPRMEAILAELENEISLQGNTGANVGYQLYGQR